MTPEEIAALRALSEKRLEHASFKEISEFVAACARSMVQDIRNSAPTYDILLSLPRETAPEEFVAGIALMGAAMAEVEEEAGKTADKFLRYVGLR